MPLILVVRIPGSAYIPAWVMLNALLKLVDRNRRGGAANNEHLRAYDQRRSR
ncbi:MAG: hypothetical protein HC822_20440 [Oscillochloris sp.]|nr:hypothetical protein [Oscillochloris sp.]